MTALDRLDAGTRVVMTKRGTAWNRTGVLVAVFPLLGRFVLLEDGRTKTRTFEDDDWEVRAIEETLS